MTHVEEHSQDWKEVAPENRRERQTLPLRQVPQTKPETRKDSRPLVLPEPASKRTIALAPGIQAGQKPGAEERP